MKTISLSVLSMSPEYLQYFSENLARIEQIWRDAKVDKSRLQLSWHFDIMDGIYVPAIAFCPQMIMMAMQSVMNPYDLHFMTDKLDPYKQALQMNKYGMDNVFVHLTTEAIMQPGICNVTFNPGQAFNKEILDSCRSVMLMSVVPGKGGQQYMPVGSKIKSLIEYRQSKNPGLRIVVDGGVNLESIEDCKDADTVVIGSAAMHAYEQGKLQQFFERFADLYLD